MLEDLKSVVCYNAATTDVHLGAEFFVLVDGQILGDSFDSIWLDINVS
jgi:hypothetical protein